MSQIGVEDHAELLAQLHSEFTPEQVQYLATQPEIYRGLAQVAAEYQQREEAADKVLAQIQSREDPENFESIANHLAQLETHEIESIHRKMNVNEDMSFAQVANAIWDIVVLEELCPQLK